MVGVIPVVIAELLLQSAFLAIRNAADKDENDVGLRVMWIFFESLFIAFVVAALCEGILKLVRLQQSISLA